MAYKPVTQVKVVTDRLALEAVPGYGILAGAEER
jgi:hypothetical protein